MPQQLVQRNGKWVLEGQDTDYDKTPFQSVHAARPAAKPAVRRAPKPAAKPRARGFWGQLQNNVQYELNQLQNNPSRSAQRLAQTVNNVVQSGGPVAGLIRTVAPHKAAQQVGLGTVGVVDNSLRLIESAVARSGGNKGGGNTALTRTADTLTDTAYRLLGAKPPSQMTPGERDADQFRRTLTATALTAAPMGIGAIAEGLPLLGAATTTLGGAVRGAIGWAGGELAGSVLQDQRSGNIANAVNDAFKWNLPGAVDVGQDDYLTAAGKSLPYDLGLSAVMGGALGGGADLLKRFPASSRWLREARQVEEISSARAGLDAAGITRSTEDGAVEFAPELTARPAAEAEAPAAPAATATPQAPAAAGGSAVAAEKPTGTEALQSVDDWIAAGDAEAGAVTPSSQVATAPAEVGDEVAQPLDPLLDYDHAAPEADVVFNGVQQLDDQSLRRLADSPEPVVQQLDEVLTPTATDPAADPNFYRQNWELVSAPSDSLSERITANYRDQLNALPIEQLRQVAHPDNSPELAGRIQALTGREWSEFRPNDIIDGLQSLADSGERLLVPRGAGAPLVPVEELAIDPARFQFKQGVDADGQQLGNSLSGVDRWDPQMEGIIQAWTDPADGQLYVVNGHNRLAKAKQLGIKSLPVQTLVAKDAVEARAAGALANIASGGGTAFDAAKFFKEGGFSGLETLQQMGVPLRSGLARDGMALSKLPDNILQDAIDGRLTTPKAVALGEAGLDEAAMQQAYKALQGREMPDSTWAEVLKLAKSSDTVQGTQVDLFGNTEAVSLMVQKADLARRIQTAVAGDKNLLGRTARKASTLEAVGNQIDKASSVSAADKARAVLGTFSAEKYAADSPISELLNEGAAEVAAGAKPGVVAERIRQQLMDAADSYQPDRTALIENQLRDEGRYIVGPLTLEADDFLNGPGRPLKVQVDVGGVDKLPADWLQRQGIKSTKGLSTQKQISLLRQYTFERLREMPEGVYALDPLDDVRARIYEKWFSGDQVPGVRRAEDPLLNTRFEYRPSEDPESLVAKQGNSSGQAVEQGITAQEAGTLDERTQLARQQLEQARAQGDEAGAAAWEKELRQLERSRIANAQDAMGQSQQDMFGVGQYDTSTPLLSQSAATAAVDIPAAASRPITAKTSEGRIQSAAESLYNWANSGVPGERQPIQSIEQARDLVRAKGAILDPDKLPGLDVDAARNAKAMGMATPGTEAVGQAYKQFYGVEGQRATAPQANPQGGIRIRDIDPADEVTPPIEGGPGLWATKDQGWRDRRAEQAREALLTDRKLKNRQAIADRVGEGEGTAAERRAVAELQAHRDAQDYLAWYDQQRATAPLDPLERQQLQVDVIRRAVENGEVRPPTTPLPELAPGPAVDLHDVANQIDNGVVGPGTPSAQAIADEYRLGRDFDERDGQVSWAQELAARDAIGFHELSFDQQKALGLTDGYQAPVGLNRSEQLASQLTERYDAPTIDALRAAGPIKESELEIKVTGATKDWLLARVDVGDGPWQDIDQQLGWGNVSPAEMGELSAAIRRELQIKPPGSAAAVKAVERLAGQLDALSGRGLYWQLHGELTPQPMKLTTPEPTTDELFIQQLIQRGQQDGSLRQALEEIGPAMEGKAGKVLAELQKAGMDGGAINTKLSAGIRSSLLELAQKDERLFRAMGEIADATRAARGDARAIQFRLPEEVKARPVKAGSSRTRVNFASDLDRAAYVLAGPQAGRAAGLHQQVAAQALEAGLHLEDLLEHGQRLRKTVQQAISDPSLGQVAIPDQGFMNGPKPSAALQAYASERLTAGQQAIQQLTDRARTGGCF